jgi:hypothetical protein
MALVLRRTESVIGASNFILLPMTFPLAGLHGDALMPHGFAPSRGSTRRVERGGCAQRDVHGAELAGDLAPLASLVVCRPSARWWRRGVSLLSAVRIERWRLY